MDVAGGVRALALNAGSSSLKAALYEVEPGAALAAPGDAVWAGAVDRDPGDAARPARALLRELPDDVDAVGHRIVHGGARFHAPAPLTDEVKAAVRSLSAARAAAQRGGRSRASRRPRSASRALPQVAVFDTAFHAGLAPAAHAYAGPHEWLERGLRRYGFHGINHEYAAHRAAHLLGRPLDELRLITCHLGSGCSLAADPRRPQRRHDDGLHAARGRGDGHALGLARPRAAPAPAARGRARRSTGSTRSCTTAPACAGSRASPATCARCSPRATAATSARGSRSTSTSTGCASTSARCSARSAALDAVVFTGGRRRARGGGPRGGAASRSRSWAWRSTRDAQRRRRRSTATSRAAGSPVRVLVIAVRGRSGRSPAPPPAFSGGTTRARGRMGRT